MAHSFIEIIQNVQSVKLYGSTCLAVSVDEGIGEITVLRKVLISSEFLSKFNRCYAMQWKLWGFDTGTCQLEILMWLSCLEAVGLPWNNSFCAQ